MKALRPGADGAIRGFEKVAEPAGKLICLGQALLQTRRYRGIRAVWRSRLTRPSLGKPTSFGYMAASWGPSGPAPGAGGAIRKK